MSSLGIVLRGWNHVEADSNSRVETAFACLDLCVIEIRPGTNVSANWARLQYSSCCTSLLQCLRTLSGTLQSVHWRAGYLCSAPSKRESAADFRGRFAA